MKMFSVWATIPKKVELELNGKTFPMTHDDHGWWRVEIFGTNPGDSYGFILDGDGPFPDPQSPLQSEGVHKCSRIVDHETFPWSDKNFQAPPLPSAIIYELHIGTFTPGGTFLSMI